MQADSVCHRLLLGPLSCPIQNQHAPIGLERSGRLVAKILHLSQVYCQLAWPLCRNDWCLALVTRRLATTREHATGAGKGETII